MSHQDAKDKQAKLAALHKWTHIDPEIPESLTLLRDDLLAQLIGKPRTKGMAIAKTKSKQPLFAPEEDTLESEEDSDHESDTELEPLHMNSGTPVRSPKSTSTASPDENATDHTIESTGSVKKKRSLPRVSSPAWNMSDQSDEDGDDPRPVIKKRKTNNASAKDTAKEKVETLDGSHFDLGLASAKYDLMITKPGQITFLFEKVSGSKL
jgi:hypothetical protein